MGRITSRIVYRIVDRIMGRIADIFSKKTSPMYYFKQTLFSKFAAVIFLPQECQIDLKLKIAWGEIIPHLQ